MNRFCKALSHLNSTQIDEKIEVLNKELEKTGSLSEQPENSIGSLYEYNPPVEPVHHKIFDAPKKIKRINSSLTGNSFCKVMSHLNSNQIDEKIKFLDKQLKKTRTILEVGPTMGTGNIYQTFRFDHTPFRPEVNSEVPDPTGFRDTDPSGTASNASDIDPSDSSTWATGGQGMDDLINPNTLPVTNGDDVSDQPVVATPDLTGFKPLRSDQNDPDSTMNAYGGIAKTSLLGVWGTSTGIIAQGNKFETVLAAFGWPTGPAGSSASLGDDYPSDRSYGGFYRTDDDKTYAARLTMKDFYNNNNVASGTWVPYKCWVAFNSYGFGQTWTQYKANPDNIWRADGYAYVTVSVYAGAATYTSQERALAKSSTTLLTQHSLDDPSYYPGNPNRFMDFLRGALDVGEKALEWLMGKAGEVVDAAEELFAGEDFSDQEKQEATDISEKPPGVVQSALENLKDALDGSIDAFKDWKGFDGKGWTMAEKAAWVSDMASQIGTAGKVYISYLSGGLEDGSIDNDFLGADYVNNAFANADINQDGNIVVGDNVIGSGGAPSYDPSTGIVTIPFNYDFDTNQEQIMKDPDKYDVNASVLTAAGMVSAWILGGKYGLDSVPVPGAGYATWLAKSVGSAQPTTGHGITMSLDDLKKVNPYLVTQLKNKGIITEGVSLSEGWESPKYTYVDKDQQKRWFKEKDVAPVYPKKAPPKMVKGWHPKFVVKLDTPIPVIKVSKKDLERSHTFKPDEVEELMQLVKNLNDYIKRNPDHLAYARVRYPKHDPRLAALNYKLDMQLAAADEYVETRFPENERLFNRLLARTKHSIKLTDPKTYENNNGKLITFNKLARIGNDYQPRKIKVKKKPKMSQGKLFLLPNRKKKDDILKDKMAVLDKEIQKTMPEA